MVIICNDKKFTFEGKMRNSELKGISGWLLLVAIGLVVTPIRLYFSTFPTYNDIF